MQKFLVLSTERIRSDEGLTLETSAFRISVRWPIYIINSVDKTKNFCILLPHRRSTTVSLETTPSFIYYIMTRVSGRYNERSDWLTAARHYSPAMPTGTCPRADCGLCKFVFVFLEPFCYSYNKQLYQIKKEKF